MKKVISIPVIVVLLFSLVSCGANRKIYDSVNDFFKSYKELDLNNANKYVEDGGLLAKSINKFDSYNDKRKDAIKYWASKISYKINKTEEKNGIGIAEVEVTALDGNYIYNNYMQNVQALQFNENQLNNNNEYGNPIGEDFDVAFLSALENQETPLKTTNIQVKLKKIDDTWKITNDSEVLTAILGGLNPNEVLD